MSAEARNKGVRIAEGIQNVAGEVQAGLDARFLGLAGLMPVLEVFRRVAYSLPIALCEGVSTQACMALLAAGAIAALAAGLLACKHGRPRQGGLLGAGAGAFFLASLGCMLPRTFGLGTATSAFSPCGFALMGVGMALLLLGWVRALAANGALANLLHVSTSVLLGDCLMFAVNALDTPPGLLALLAACLAVSCAALGWIEVGQNVRRAREAEGGNTGAQVGHPADEQILWAVVRSSLSGPAVGLALGTFCWGVMAIPPSSYASDHKAWVYLAGDLVASAVILALMYALRGGARYEAMRQKMFFLLPAFAVFMSYFSFIRMLDADGGLKNFLSIGYNMSMDGFFTLFAVSCAAQCREKGLPAEAVAAPALIACTLSFGLGATLYELYGNVALYFQIVFTTLYILGLAFISAWRATLNDDSRLEERCTSSAARFGLSQREEEVLRLTVAGYSPARIAEELSISPETVRTHKKRIYAKLDVHRHDELMRVVRTGKK